MEDEYALFAVACCCVLVLAGAVFAQSDRGTMTGAITDPAGAVIQNPISWAAQFTKTRSMIGATRTL